MKIYCYQLGGGLISHKFPMKPLAHVHLKPVLASLKQWPFLHGLGSQGFETSLILRSQKTPVVSLIQRQTWRLADMAIHSAPF